MQYNQGTPGNWRQKTYNHVAVAAGNVVSVGKKKKKALSAFYCWAIEDYSIL